MKISDSDKQKLEKYLNDRGLPLLNQGSFKNNKNYKKSMDEMPDIMDLIVGSLSEQMIQNSFEIAKKSEEELEFFRSKLSLQIFNQALVLAVEDQSNFDSKIIGELSASASFDEAVLKIGVYIQEFPEFAYKFVVYTIATYILYCLQYKMIPNEKILSIYSAYLNN